MLPYKTGTADVRIMTKMWFQHRCVIYKTLTLLRIVESLLAVTMREV